MNEKVENINEAIESDVSVPSTFEKDPGRIKSIQKSELEIDSKKLDINIPTSKHEIVEVYAALILKAITLAIVIFGGIFGYLFIDRVTIDQKKAEIEHKQVQLAISITKVDNPNLQSDMLEVLKAAYTFENTSNHMNALIEKMELNIKIAIRQKESVKALKEEVVNLNKEIEKKDTKIDDQKIFKKKIVELEHEISLLSNRRPVTKSIDLNVKKNIDVAIIVGHKASSPGAISNDGELSEHSIALELSNKISAKLSTIGISSTILHRNTYSELPAQVNETKAKLSISLHANAFDGKVSGSNVLYPSGDLKSEKLAMNLLDAMTESLGLKNRGIRATGPENRGGYLLNNVNMPIVILLPFFIDNEDDLSKYKTNMSVMVNNLAYSTKKYLKETL